MQRGVGGTEGSLMDILWVALAVCVIVGFVFVVLARHWQRLLVHQSWTIRRLTDRVASLEEVADPNFRRKLDESAPSPLERVYTFSFRVNDDFWRKTVKATPRQLQYIRDHGNFLGSVKIEVWRSHTVVTVTEVLPQAKSATWQTRSFDVFPDDLANADQAITLWEMSLADEKFSANSGRVPTLELRWREGELELCSRSDHFMTNEDDTITLAPQEQMLFAVPLNSERLAQFRAADESGNGDMGDVIERIAEGSPVAAGNSWVVMFEREDDSLGIEWNLSLRDLTRQSDWKRWKVFEPMKKMTKVG
jgi:cell division protein FtsL